MNKIQMFLAVLLLATSPLYAAAVGKHSTQSVGIFGTGDTGDAECGLYSVSGADDCGDSTLTSSCTPCDICFDASGDEGTSCDGGECFVAICEVGSTWVYIDTDGGSGASPFTDAGTVIHATANEDLCDDASCTDWELDGATGFISKDANPIRLNETGDTNYVEMRAAGTLDDDAVLIWGADIDDCTAGEVLEVASITGTPVEITLECDEDGGGAESNDLEATITGIEDAEVLIGNGSSSAVYVAGLAACATDEKIEYVPGSPDTLTCEQISGLVDADIGDIALGGGTSGNYVASITNGTGISGGDGGSEGAALTLAATLGTDIVTGEIVDGTILEADLDESSGTPTDNDVLTYNLGGTNFTWVAQSTLDAGSVEGTDFGTLTDTKFCIYDSGSTAIICNSEGGGGGSNYVTNDADDTMVGDLTLDDDDVGTALTVRADAAGTGATVGVLITTDDDDSANYTPLEIRDDSGVANDLLFEVDTAGSVTMGTDLLMIDPTNGGEFNINLSDDTGPDGSVTLQVDVAGNLIPFVYLDGISESIVFDKQLFMAEESAALGDSSGYGQVWVKAGAPNTLWFTDENGADVQLGNGLTDAQVNNDLTLAGGTIGTSAITLVQSASPTPTAEGVIEWDTDDLLVVGDGAAGQAVFYPDAHTADEVETLETGKLCGNDGTDIYCDINTQSEIETALGGLDLVAVTADDITSADLATLVSDEVGTNKVVFSDAPTISGKVIRNAVSVDDDDCTGEQGDWWYDDTDSAFEFCNANSGAPAVLGGSGSGDVTDVGDCEGPACFTSGSPDAALTFDNATSGTVTLQTVAGALGTVTVSLPAATDTLVGKDTVDTLTQKTLTAPAITGTATWSSTPVLESGTAFTFGDGTDATITHTYANTGTDVTVAYSTAAMAVTGALTATSFGGITEGNLVDKAATESISGGWDWTDTGTFDFGGPVTGTSFTADASATPSLLLIDSTTDGEFKIAISDGSGPDAVADFQVDVADSLATYLQLDGINEDVEVSEPLNLSHGTSAGEVNIFEGSGGGSNWIKVVAPATIGTNRTCTLEDDATPFDNCVSGGSESTSVTDSANGLDITLSTYDIAVALDPSEVVNQAGDLADLVPYEDVTDGGIHHMTFTQVQTLVGGSTPDTTCDTGDQECTFDNDSITAGSSIDVDAVTGDSSDDDDLDVAAGGTGVSTLADGGLVIGNAGNDVEVVAAGATTDILVGGGAGTAPIWTTAQGSGAPVRATSPALTTPNIGTPSAGTLTSCTGLPISTGVSGLGSGVATWLGTASSLNLATAVTGETGTGALVFGTDPVFTTSMAIPRVNGDVVVNASGEIAVDDSDDHLAIYMNGTGSEIGDNGGEAVLSPIDHISVVISPATHYDVDTQVFLFTVGDEAPNGIRIDEWKVSCNVDPNYELDLDLKRATAWIGLGSAALMDVLDTTTGTSTEDTDSAINSDAIVANGQVIYLEFGADPDASGTNTCVQMVFEMWFHAEED